MTSSRSSRAQAPCKSAPEPVSHPPPPPPTHRTVTASRPAIVERTPFVFPCFRDIDSKGPCKGPCKGKAGLEGCGEGRLAASGLHLDEGSRRGPARAVGPLKQLPVVCTVRMVRTIAVMDRRMRPRIMARSFCANMNGTYVDRASSDVHVPKSASGAANLRLAGVSSVTLFVAMPAPHRMTEWPSRDPKRSEPARRTAGWRRRSCQQAGRCQAGPASASAGGRPPWPCRSRSCLPCVPHSRPAVNNVRTPQPAERA